MPDEGSTSNRPDPVSNLLEREESQLWRWALGLLVLLAAAVAALSWQQLKDLPYQLWAIPAGLFLLAILFATYAFGRKREVSEHGGHPRGRGVKLAEAVALGLPPSHEIHCDRQRKRSE